MPPPSTTAGVLLFAPETPFSRPLRVTPHHRTAASSSSSPPAPPGPPGLVREVFGHLHLRGGGGLSRRLEGLSTDLDMARLYLSIHELDRAERLFEDGVARCRAARPFRGGSALPYRDSGRGVPVAARASSASAQPGYDPLLYASAMVGLARVRIARLRGAGQGQLGVDASSNGDADAWLALPRAAEDAVRLLNGGIRAAAEAGVSAEHLFLGEALGALGELLEVLPDLLGEEHDDHRTAAAAAAAGESREQMRARVSESFVAAIALCAGGIGGHRDAIRQEQSGSGDVGGHPEVSMRQEEEQNGDDPQKRPDAWCENAVIDMVRIQGAAARCVPPGRKAYRFQALARQVAALAIDRFGRQSTVVAQALHDLGRVGAKAQSVSGAHPARRLGFHRSRTPGLRGLRHLVGQHRDRAVPGHAGQGLANGGPPVGGGARHGAQRRERSFERAAEVPGQQGGGTEPGPGRGHLWRGGVPERRRARCRGARV